MVSDHFVNCFSGLREDYSITYPIPTRAKMTKMTRRFGVGAERGIPSRAQTLYNSSHDKGYAVRSPHANATPSFARGWTIFCPRADGRLPQTGWTFALGPKVCAVDLSRQMPVMADASHLGYDDTWRQRCLPTRNYLFSAGGLAHGRPIVYNVPAFQQPKEHIRWAM